MASSSGSSTASDQQTTEGIGEAVVANVGISSSSSDDFARQQFCKNRKVIIQGVPRVTYEARIIFDKSIICYRMLEFLCPTAKLRVDTWSLRGSGSYSVTLPLSLKITLNLTVTLALDIYNMGPRELHTSRCFFYFLLLATGKKRMCGYADVATDKNCGC